MYTKTRKKLEENILGGQKMLVSTLACKSQKNGGNAKVVRKLIVGRIDQSGWEGDNKNVVINKTKIPGLNPVSKAREDFSKSGSKRRKVQFESESDSYFFVRPKS